MRHRKHTGKQKQSGRNCLDFVGRVVFVAVDVGEGGKAFVQSVDGVDNLLPGKPLARNELIHHLKIDKRPRVKNRAHAGGHNVKHAGPQRVAVRLLELKILPVVVRVGAAAVKVNNLVLVEGHADITLEDALHTLDVDVATQPAVPGVDDNVLVFNGGDHVGDKFIVIGVGEYDVDFGVVKVSCLDVLKRFHRTHPPQVCRLMHHFKAVVQKKRHGFVPCLDALVGLAVLGAIHPCQNGDLDRQGTIHSVRNVRGTLGNAVHDVVLGKCQPRLLQWCQPCRHPHQPSLSDGTPGSSGVPKVPKVSCRLVVLVGALDKILLGGAVVVDLVDVEGVERQPKGNGSGFV
eukprot:m.23783 g.23783  ORF g.23783 m.23783 type:complete len:346 (-) comp7290_c0_seq1:533-1570(-)